MHDDLEDYRKGYEKAAEYYNLFADNIDIPFYLDYAKEAGSPVLDLAAGTGRVAFELAKKGHEVVAIENSSAMLEVFRKELSQHESSISKRIRLIEADMRDFSLNRKFQLIIIPTSFGHALTSDEQLSLLRCVYNHLESNGLFILDLFPGGRQPEFASFEEPPVPIDRNRTVSRSGIMKKDPVKQILSLELTFTIRDANTGDTIDEIHLKSGAALVFNREANLLLKLSNLHCIQEYGDFLKNPYTPESGRRIMIVKRRD